MSNGPNGAPQPGEGQAWTPAQRKLWLKTMGAPDDFVLLTTAEMMNLMDGVKQARAVASDLSDMFRFAIKLLGAYEKTEPDFINAVGAAAFDADRYGKLVEKLAEAIPEIKKRLDLAFAGETVDKKGLEEVSAALAYRLVMIVSVMAQRRQRTKPPSPPQPKKPR